LAAVAVSQPDKPLRKAIAILRAQVDEELESIKGLFVLWQMAQVGCVGYKAEADFFALGRSVDEVNQQT